MTCRTIFDLDTVHFADSVEWNAQCPALLACGTYQLDEAAQQRNGRVLLLRAEPGQRPLLACATPLRPGALDLTWLAADRLASADASGHVTLFSSELQEQARVPVCPDAALVLSVDSSGQRMCASDSAGHVTLIDPAAQAVIQRWSAHGFEAWCAALAPVEPDLVMSGGDDCRLRLWDLRDGAAKSAASVRFDMGVTCGAFHPENGHLLAVGSYDERASLWDRRAMRAPLTEASVGGGVWRLKWCRSGGRRLLAAAMHAGFKVLGASERWDLAEVAHYSEHDSLAYGADWRTEGDQSYSVATCSFYDHALKIWELEIPVGGS